MRGKWLLSAGGLLVLVLVLVFGIWGSRGGNPDPVFVERSSFLADDLDDLAREMAISPDGLSVVTVQPSSDDVLVWDVESWEVTARLTGHSSGLNDVAFSSEGLVGSASWRDSSARVWDPVSGEMLQRWEFPKPRLNDLQVAFSPDGSLFAMSGSSPIRLWDVDSGELVVELSSEVLVLDIAFSPDGSLLYAAANDDRVLVWNVASGEVVHELMLPLDTDPFLGLSADGSVLATSPSASEYVLWDTTTWDQVGLLTVPEIEDGGLPFGVRRPSFSADGSMIVTATSEGILVWDVASGEVIHRDPKRRYSEEAVFSPVSNQIAVTEFTVGYTLWEPTGLE